MKSNYCESCKTYTVCALPRTRVCLSCGLEQSVPYDMYEQSKICMWNNISFQTGYSRKKRFGKLFDSVVIGAAETKDEKMLIYLKSVTINSMDDLLLAIKESGLIDKRYGSIHLFCRVYVSEFSMPKQPKHIPELRKRILFQFENLEFSHLHKLKNRPFFNYRWLLSKILGEAGIHQFKPFIKVIKCKKRREYYENMYEVLSASVHVKNLG